MVQLDMGMGMGPKEAAGVTDLFAVFGIINNG